MTSGGGAGTKRVRTGPVSSPFSSIIILSATWPSVSTLVGLSGFKLALHTVIFTPSIGSATLAENVEGSAFCINDANLATALVGFAEMGSTDDAMVGLET